MFHEKSHLAFRCAAWALGLAALLNCAAARGDLTSQPSTLAATKATQPAPPTASANPSAQMDRLRAVLTSRCGQLAIRLKDQPQAASASLLALQEACLGVLSNPPPDADPETRQRCLDILTHSSLQCRLMRALAMLDPPQCRKLLELHRRQPVFLAEAFSDDMVARIRALRALAAKKDPQQLVEPLLTVCLWHSYRPLRTAAAELVLDQEYASDELTEAVTDLAVKAIRMGRLSYGTAFESAEGYCLLYLYRTHPPKAVPKLLAALLETTDRVRAYMLVDLLLQFGDKSIVPLLVPKCARWRDRPWILAMVVKLSGQKLENYKIRLEGEGMPGYGAYEVENGDAAAQKIRDWWRQNKDRPEYSQLKPPAIPKLPALQYDQDEVDLEEPNDDDDISPTPQLDLPAPTPTALPQTEPSPEPLTLDASVFDTAGIASLLRRQVSTRLAALGAEHLKARAAAEEDILSVHQAMLDALLRARQEHEAPVLDVLSDLAARAQLACALAGMTPSDRQKVLDFRHRYPQIVEGLFWPAWKQQLQALGRIALIDDGLAQAEPLVVLALRHPWLGVRNKALSLTAKGTYRSDATVDALCDLLHSPSRWQMQTSRRLLIRRRLGGGIIDSDGQTRVDPAKVLHQLTEIHSPRCAPALLSILINSRASEFVAVGDGTVAEALAATAQLGAIPLLCQALVSPEEQFGSITVGGQRWSISSRDAPLLSLLLLTSQPLENYQMRMMQENGSTVVGFADIKARAAAIEKFKT